MNRQEATGVLRKVVAYQPNQRMDELTNKAWSEALAPYDVRDALEAVHELATCPRMPGQPFWMEVRDVIAEICRMRHNRYEQRKHLLPLPPPEVAEDPEGYRRWMHATVEAASSRDWTAPPQLPAPTNAHKAAHRNRLREALATIRKDAS